MISSHAKMPHWNTQISRRRKSKRHLLTNYVSRNAHSICTAFRLLWSIVERLFVKHVLINKTKLSNYYVCMYVCIYVCILYACTYGLHVFVCFYLFICMYTCMYTCLYVCLYLFVCMTHVYIHVCMYISVCIYVCMNIHDYFKCVSAKGDIAHIRLQVHTYHHLSTHE